MYFPGTYSVPSFRPAQISNIFSLQSARKGVSVNSADSRPSAVPEPVGSRRHWHAITASYLGWTLDAFDFFIVVFLVDTLADQFGVAKSAIVWTITATLAMRPLGAIF